jgi:high-affinity Fe2+/Pb2+ permease
MLLVKMAVLIIAFVIVAVLICLTARRIKTKPIIPGNVPWIFYLIEKMFGENDSSLKEVKKNEMS